MQIEKRPPRTESSPFVQLVGGLKCLAGRFDVHEGNGDSSGRLSRPIFTRQRLDALHWAVPVGRRIRLGENIRGKIGSETGWQVVSIKLSGIAVAGNAGVPGVDISKSGHNNKNLLSHYSC